jgi:enoyl-CoA hydratase/carnithine racemase
MIRFEVYGQIAVITFDNGRLNILTREMHHHLYVLMLRFLRSDDLKVAVLTCGEGQSFSAGDDLTTIDDDFGEEPDWEELTMRLDRDKPMIGAVRGYCIGQGLIYLALLTDIRLASRQAEFGFPEITKGMGGAGGMARLGAQIPYTAAMQMLMTGDFISAEEARRYFLINEVEEEDALLPRAMELAERVARHPLVALRAEMQACQGSGTNAVDNVIQANRLYDWQRNVLGR